MIRPALAVEAVDAAVAGDEIVEFVTAPIDVAGAGEGEALDIRSQRIGERAQYRINAFVHGFCHRVTQIVHNVGVIARATGHGIFPEPSIKHIGERYSR